MDNSRRIFLTGGAGQTALAVQAQRTYAQSGARTANASGAPTSAVAGGVSTAPHEPFLARSDDGTMLAGNAQGDPQAPEILFLHGLRSYAGNWVTP